MADRSVSAPMTLSDLERRNTSVNGRGFVLGSAICPHLKRAGSERSHFLGPLLFIRRTTKLDVVTQCLEGCILWSATTHSPRVFSFSIPQILGFSCISAYTL